MAGSDRQRGIWIVTESDSLAAEAQLQDWLVKLWTCHETRQRFLADRKTFLAGLTLTESVRSRLAMLDAKELTAYANSLVAKRLGQVKKRLSGVAVRLGNEFDRRFFEWAFAHPPARESHHADDAWRFGQTLRGLALTPETRDILRWQLLAQRLHRKGWRCGVMYFRYDIRGHLDVVIRRHRLLVCWWTNIGNFGPGVKIFG